MRLANRKRLLNSLAAVFVTVGVIAIWSGATYEVEPPAEVSPTTSTIASGREEQRAARTTLNADGSAWRIQLQRPLYDPPPRPKKIVKKKPRPINVKLVGTVLEANNSQAFVKLANGSVELRQEGDQLTANPLDGKVAKISATEIIIVRDDGEFQVGLEGRN